MTSLSNTLTITSTASLSSTLTTTFTASLLSTVTSTTSPSSTTSTTTLTAAPPCGNLSMPCQATSNQGIMGAIVGGVVGGVAFVVMIVAFWSCILLPRVSSCHHAHNIADMQVPPGIAATLGQAANSDVAQPMEFHPIV